MPVDAWWQMHKSDPSPPAAGAPSDPSIQNTPAPLAAAAISGPPIASSALTSSSCPTCPSRSLPSALPSCPCSSGPAGPAGPARPAPVLQHLLYIFSVGVLAGSALYLAAMFYKILNLALPPPEAGQPFAMVLSRLAMGVLVVSIIFACFVSLPDSTYMASMYPLRFW